MAAYRISVRISKTVLTPLPLLLYSPGYNLVEVSLLPGWHYKNSSFIGSQALKKMWKKTSICGTQSQIFSVLEIKETSPLPTQTSLITILHFHWRHWTECIGPRLYDDSDAAGACHDARGSISFVTKANWIEAGASLGAFVVGPEEKISMTQ